MQRPVLRLMYRGTQKTVGERVRMSAVPNLCSFAATVIAQLPKNSAQDYSKRQASYRMCAAMRALRRETHQCEGYAVSRLSFEQVTAQAQTRLRCG